MSRRTADGAGYTRQTILHAARDLFAIQGYDRTTISGIAQAANVAVGTVYLYFTNKRTILLTVCLALNLEITASIQPKTILALPAARVPRALIEAVFGKGREYQRLLPLCWLELHAPAEAAFLRPAKEQLSATLSDYFRRLVAQERLSPFKTAAYAELLGRLVSASLRQCYVIESGEREVIYREALIEMIERLFFGSL